jgi:hypothetical protein
MKRILLGGLVVGASLLLFNRAASAETRNGFYSQDEYQLTHSMFDQINADLDQAQTDAGSSRFDMARSELNRLEQDWDQGRFESREIATAISALQTAANDNRLMPRQRDALDADISRLLDFRTAYY